MSKIIVGFCCYLLVACSVSSYEYGYHPSSEEFDSLLREKTWTRDLMWHQRNVKKFVPKFNLNKPKDATSLGSTSPFSGGSGEKNDKFIESDMIALSSENVAEVNKNPLVNEMQLNRTTLPIFFTNPATGIVYAITEVGVNKDRTGLPINGTIPIFVSKEQYERDLYILKRAYESKCVREGQPPILKMNKDGFINKLVKRKLDFKVNTTGVNRIKKGKRGHRKAKKNKILKNPILIGDKQGNISSSLVLDTQLEKPTKIILPSIFSRDPPPSKSLKSVIKRKQLTKNSTKKVIHKISRRSLNLTEKSTTTRSLNFTDSKQKSKKILSTQIQVTSEYLEPPLKVRTPKNSVEESIQTKAPPTTTKAPCKQIKTKAKKPVQDDYDDYYGFGGTSYDDDTEDDDDDDESDGSEEHSDETYETSENSSENENKISSFENSISDYSSIEENVKQDNSHNYSHKKTTKKRTKRRRPYGSSDYSNYDDDYDNDSDDDDEGVFGLFRGLLTPVQWLMDRFFDRAEQMFDDSPQLSENNDNRKPKYPQYTVYNSGVNDLADFEETESDQGNSIGSWLGSWFGFKRRRKINVSSTISTLLDEEPGWFESWFGYDVKTPAPYEEANDPWFFGWFGGKQRPKRTTTTTTTTTVPILTIAEPLKNPQKWIGILAQHIINSTSTKSPQVETTTENPDIPKKISYNKFQIWRLKPKDDSQVRILEEIKRGEEGAKIQWLKGPTLRGLNDVLIPPKNLVDFKDTLAFENIPHETLIFDVGRVISYEKSKQNDIKPSTGKAIMSWKRYYDYDSIIKYLELIQIRNSQFVELIHIGRSYEGRPLVIAKIAAKKVDKKYTKKKKLKLNKNLDQLDGVFIEAGVHGREWIAPASATWIINELLKIMKNNQTHLGTEYIKNTTWYIMPVANPDSYEYSHQYDRLWKKSRSRHISRPNGIINSAMTWLQKKKSQKICYGVDLDCNWSYNWGKQGSSKSPCNEFFSGPTPFSEPETKALSKFLMDNRKQIKLFVSLQAYGQIISYPSKVNSSYQAQKLDDLFDVAMVGSDGLRKKGSNARYKVDATNDLIEYKTGTSDYFSSFEVGIPFSYTIHLADNGVHGFLLPSTLIEPTAKDAFEIITAMIDYI